ALIAAFARHRRAIVAGVLVVALLLLAGGWLATALILLRTGIGSWFLFDFWFAGAGSAAYGLAFALAVAAWILGRRQNLVGLALVPIAGAVVGAASWWGPKLLRDLW